MFLRLFGCCHHAIDYVAQRLVADESSGCGFFAWSEFVVLRLALMLAVFIAGGCWSVNASVLAVDSYTIQL